MSSITSGTGLISGLDIAGIVTKLMSIERRPSDQIKASRDKNSEIQSSLNALSLRMIGTNLSLTKLNAAGAFLGRTATSSNDSVSASASSKATIGSFAFTPKRLVSTQQSLSGGYSSSADLVGAGTLKIAFGGFVDTSTKLAQLNGGKGVGLGSIRITDQAGGSGTIDLTGATTINDVVEAINGTSGANVRAEIDGDKLKLIDGSGGLGTLQVNEVGSSTTAGDLGLRGLTRNGASYTGGDLVKLDSSTLLADLNDGNGVQTNALGLDDLNITIAGPTNVNVDIDLSGAQTVGEALTAINSAIEGQVGAGVATASIDDNGLKITAAGSSSITVSALNSSMAAHDLGLGNITAVGGGMATGRNIAGGLNTVLLSSLNGGYRGGADTQAVPGSLVITTGSGPTTVDLANASTLQDVVKGINDAGIANVTARVNDARNGLVVTDASGGTLAIADSTGNLASFLKLDGASVGGVVRGGDLERQYISQNTRLETLNGGTGVPKGKFKVTDGNGVAATIDLTQETDNNIGVVLSEINSRGLALVARLNDAGDGILLEKTGGAASIAVEEVEGGTTAKALGLARTADASGNIDGSFAVKITLTATDKLSDLQTKLQEAGAPVSANILNTGGGATPFKLSLTSQRSGAAGELMIDGGNTSLRFSTISRAADAVMLYGNTGGGAIPVQLTGNSNTFTNVVPGLSVDAKAVATTPATVTVNQNVDGIVSAVKDFVEKYNDTVTYLREQSKYDGETGTKGTLFTENSARVTASRLSEFINRSYNITGSSLRSASQAGMSIGDNGELKFDEETFRSAYTADATSVEKFFTTAKTGFVASFNDLNEQLTGVAEGLLTGRSDSLTTTIDRQNSNVDRLEIQLTSKQERLYRQYYGMETALAKLQGQQSALSQLSSLASSMSAVKF